MKTLPSKELLSEVLKINVTEVYERRGEIRFRTHTNRADGWDSSSDTPIPNIYELAYKCKEDATKYNYFISSFISNCMQGKGEATIQDENGNKKVFVADTEPEAIFKAREWLRKYLKDNQ